MLLIIYICFSKNPPDLPTALPMAQELEQNHERYRFANAFANSKNSLPSTAHSSSNVSSNAIAYQHSPNHEQMPQYDRPVRMEIDKGTSYFRKPTAFRNSVGIEHRGFNPDFNVQKFVAPENHPKRVHASNNSGQSPVQKIQRINYVENYQSNESIHESEDFSGIDSENDAVDDLNFLV